MRKDWLSIQIVRGRASVYGIQIGSSAHESGAVIVLHHHSMDATDDHRSIIIANDSTPMMDDADSSPFDWRQGKLGG
jgi:hypothetical protein